MDEKGFAKFCKTSKRLRRHLDDKAIAENIAAVKEFESFLRKNRRRRGMGTANEADAMAYSEHLVKSGKNTWDTYISLMRYARFLDNREVELSILNLLDGVNVLPDLSNTLKKRVGAKNHAKILGGLEMPPLGSPITGWPVITKRFMKNLEGNLTQKRCRSLLLTGPHAGPPEDYQHERELFLKSKDLDDFLKKRHRQSVKTLETHMKEKTLFYTQEIDRNVLDFVKGNQEIMGGVRVGDVIYETKIPYMTREYLAERDPKMKRYYGCHCPWARESILSGVDISPDFCYCSAGYHKRPWDVIFGKPVWVDVEQSILKGDPICRLSIRIPKGYSKPRAKKERRRGANR